MELDALERKMVVWANTYPDKPAEIVNYEFLSAGKAGAALTGISGTITQWDITGSYEGEYQFALYLRIKPGDSNDVRLKAVESLNAFGHWARKNMPDLGSLEPVSIEIVSRAAVIAAYQNGDEDYQIQLKLTYKGVN